MKPPASPSTAVAWLAGGWLASTLAVQAVLESAGSAGSFVTTRTWAAVVQSLGGSVDPSASQVASVPFLACGLIVAAALAVAAGLTKWRGGALRVLGKAACVPGVWFVLTTAVLILDWPAAAAVLSSSADLAFALPAAGWLATLLTPREETDLSARRVKWTLTAAIGAYVVVFTAMNWGLYWSLNLPHGDSAMYEEHLWNLLHGKGFRSYLDQGLFLGEHIQVVHLLLIPLYAVFPSHLTLELCESAALASSAWPAFLLARRYGGSDRAALLLACGVLLYAPLHFLDIEIDRKSFRPICFGVPAMLWAFHFLEARRWKSYAAAAVVALTAKEDYALILGPLGVWRAVTGWKEKPDRYAGIATAVLAGAYLLLAVKVVIPHFRGGETVHYARYFPQFGETPAQILWGMLTNPGVVASAVLTAPAFVYVLRTFAPIGFAPLLSGAALSRLCVGLPELGLLLLNKLSFDPPAPVHHFHGPLVPVLVWAAAASLRQPTPARRDRLAAWAYAAALCTGVTAGYGPLSIPFYDPGGEKHFAARYLPGERSEQFAKVIAAIPPDARVASTDYVHPRFTHHERSYDYSGYVRRVAGDTTAVPPDTDYIVLDVRGPYSQIAGPESVRELRESPRGWEVLGLDTGGYFIVLRRRRE